MVKTQIQLPDELYKKVKKLAKAKEISVAEICRRGLEYVVSLHPIETINETKWELPEPRRLGIPKIHYSKWRELVYDRNDSLD